MSTRTVIELNHDYLGRLMREPWIWERLVQALVTCNANDADEQRVLAALGIRILAQRHHSETLRLKVE